MAGGDITTRITDVHVDIGRNRITYSITKDVELADGTKVSLTSLSQVTDVPATQALQAMTIGSLTLNAPASAGSFIIG